MTTPSQHYADMLAELDQAINGLWTAVTQLDQIGYHLDDDCDADDPRYALHAQICDALDPELGDTTDTDGISRLDALHTRLRAIYAEHS